MDQNEGVLIANMLSPSPIDIKIGPAMLAVRICGICAHHASAYAQQ